MPPRRAPKRPAEPQAGPSHHEHFVRSRIASLEPHVRAEIQNLPFCDSNPEGCATRKTFHILRAHYRSETEIGDRIHAQLKKEWDKCHKSRPGAPCFKKSGELQLERDKHRKAANKCKEAMDHETVVNPREKCSNCGTQLDSEYSSSSTTTTSTASSTNASPNPNNDPPPSNPSTSTWAEQHWPPQFWSVNCYYFVCNQQILVLWINYFVFFTSDWFFHWYGTFQTPSTTVWGFMRSQRVPTKGAVSINYTIRGLYSW